MKTLFKSVSAAFVTLFLSISLSGCFDEGSKTASQSDAGDSGSFGSIFASGDAHSVKKFSGDQNWHLVMKGGFLADDPDLKAFLSEFLSDPDKKGIVSSVGNGFVSISFKWKGGGSLRISSGLKEKLDTYTLQAESRGALWALSNGAVREGRV